MPTHGTYRSVELSGGDGNHVLQAPGSLCQARRSGQSDRRTAELERAADDADEASILMPRWSVDIHPKKGERLGIVDAPNLHEALTKAVALFHIQPALRNKLAITKLHEPEPKGRRKSRKT